MAPKWGDFVSVELSRESDALICVLYREYLTRRAHGVPISRAGYFRDDSSIRENFLPAWAEDDVNEVCWRLAEKGLLSVQPGDDKANDVTLTDEGIIYMERRFSRKVSLIVSYLEKLAAFLPL